MIALIFVGRLMATSAALANHTNPENAAHAMTLTLLPWLLGIVAFAFIAAEIIYYAYRAYLLRRLQNRR